MKRRMRIVLSIVMALSLFAALHGPVVTSAGEWDQDFRGVVYSTIRQDYMVLTGLTQSESDLVFNSLESEFDYETVSNKVCPWFFEGEDSTNQFSIERANSIQDEYNHVREFIQEEDVPVLNQFVLFYFLETYCQNYSLKDIEELAYSRSMLTENSNGSRGPNVALLTIFASDSGLSSSGTYNTIGHAWIQIENISSSSISIGAFSGIASGCKFVIGTWFGPPEHNGLWYSYEDWLETYTNNPFDTTYVSKKVYIDSQQLSSLNSYILNHDSWGVLNNCSNFACTAWNLVTDSANHLSAGAIPTPATLKSNIIAAGGYYIHESFSSSYLVYYANGSGTPIASTQYLYN